MMKAKIAVLVSGGGTNLQALIDAVKSGIINSGEIAFVISNNADAYALTRAKNELSVHYYGSFMEGKPLDGVSYQQDMTLYPEPNGIVLQLGHKDVVLDFFKDRKAKILSLQSGEPLYADGSYLLYDDRGVKKKLIKLSKKAQEQLELLSGKGYRMQSAEIRFVVAWKHDDAPEEHAIVLPTLYMVK
jgi:ATP-dependent DNA helicase RecQ